MLVFVLASTQAPTLTPMKDNATVGKRRHGVRSVIGIYMSASLYIAG